MSHIITPRWTRSQQVEERLSRGKQIYYVNGIPYYQGRHIIHRDTQIDGGVSIGATPREAIVVDSKYPAIKELYEKAKRKASKRGIVRRDWVLESSYDVVLEAMPLRDDNNERVEELTKNLGVNNDVKIDLGYFLERGIGVCRHYALACGVLLELFKKDNYISGTPSIDRNQRLFDAHVWCRYTSSDNQIMILDPSSRWLGLLEESLKRGSWDYRRPEEIK